MRPRNSRRQPLRDERGMTSIEYAIIVVAFFLIIFTVVQAAFFYRARGDARSAAAACAEAARGDRAGNGQGRSSGESVVRQGGNMRSYSVSVSSSGTQVRCTVSGQAMDIIDLGLSGIHETAAMPKDRVTR